MNRFRNLYGAGPGHLLGVVACFALAALALPRFLDAGPLASLALWVLGALVLHDLVFLPLYTGLDGALRRATRKARVPVINHVRVPVLLSGLLFLVWFPLILRLGDRFEPTTGNEHEPFLGRWLALTALFFAVSAVLFVARVVRRGRASRSGEPRP